MSPKWDIFSENLHIARVLLIILCAACGCCSQAKDSLSAPRDLRVFVFEESPEDIVTDENYTLLKFNISWLPPEAPLSPKYYSILISSVENAENTHDDALDNVSDCPLEENIFQTTWNAEQTSIVLPENKFLSEIPELTIRPTCTYEIQVIAQPRAAGTSNTAKINFTVPNCVGKSCNCRDAYEHLPVPQVYGEVLESGEIEIRWEIAKNHSPVSSYVLSYAVPLLISKNDLPVYNISKLVQLPGNTSNYIMNIDLSTSISSPMGHAILLATEDANGCLGKPFAFSMSDEPKLEQSTKRIRNGPLYISIAVVCIVILGGLSFVCTRRCDKYKIILPSSPTAIPSLTGISDRVQWVNSILKKHNSLYIHRDNELEAPEIGVDAFEISYERLRISKELGKGQFGRVYLGYLDNDFPVAVKLSNSSTKFDELEARRQLLDEIQTMKRVGSHSHLVKLIGCCTLPDNPICVVLEYVEGGDLLCYLHQLRDTLIKKCGDSRQRGHHNDADMNAVELDGRIYVNIRDNELLSMSDGIDNKRFTSFALDIARGMQHLEKNGIVHRDLAARNILLTPQKSLKIADFGLSREGVYIIHENGIGGRRLPARWMAPETLSERAFSNKSDVWSYGVVLWEIETLGSFPYAEIQDDEILHHIVKIGTRLPLPGGISTVHHEIMRRCWSTRPRDRPNFSDIVERLATPNPPSPMITSSNPCYALQPSSYTFLSTYE
ncbi:platelet-derived growth factor receptor alpha isoform X4 [Diachasma alloeum]|uniref:platelet-derived growth factor receptor alpha isoform X4 n=1 Tax=Diachasma alloeum TaxID=454923 RepID=UPI0007384883|nr:platelet-derived growth factor receptor alpha isoform X4 [Diachasma alloeum]